MHLLLVLFLLGISACQTSFVEKDYFDINGKGDNLTSTILQIDSARVGLQCCCIIGDKLIVMRVGTLHRYEIYTVKEKHLIFDGNFLNIGRGSDEMLNPKFQYDPKNNCMYLYSKDNQENKLFIVDLKNFNNVYDSPTWVKKKLPIIYTRGELGILNDTLFLNKNDTKTSSMFSLSYASNRDNQFKSLNFQYPGEHPNLSSVGQCFLFTGSMKKRPGYTTFAYSCYFSQYVFIFDVVNEQIKNTRYISQVLPVYKVTNDLYNPFSIANEYRSGFNQYQVTENLIYIGYNNATWGNIRNSIPYKDYPSSHFDRINVFDWKGNFVKRLLLDRPINFFTVDEDDSYIYASSINLEQENQPDQVLRFKL